MRNLIQVLFLLFFFSGNLFAQLNGIVIGKDFNGLPLPELIRYIEQEQSCKFYYLTRWIDSVIVVQDETPANLEKVLTGTFSKTSLSYFADKKNNIIITDGYNIVKSSLTATRQEVQLTTSEYRKPVVSSFIINEMAKPVSKSNQHELITIGVQGNISKDSRAIVSGKISELESGQPIIGAVIIVNNLNTGTVSDADGYYVLSVPPGRHEIIVKYLGQKDKNLNINVNGNGTLDVMMEERMIELRGVVINAGLGQNIRGLQLGMNKLDINQIKHFPVTIGEVDLIKTALLLPGVQTVGEGASGFNVRGGGTDQNLVLMDGAPLFNTSHMFGFFSVFNSDAVKEFDLYKSSIPAQFGGRLSSVLDVKMKEGNLKKLAVSGGISPVAARLSVDGPIIKDKATILLSSRETYSDWILRRTNIKTLKNSAASFLDLNAKLYYKINEKNQLTVSSYYSNDQFKLRSDTLYSYNNLTSAISFKHAFTKTLIGVFSGIYSKYDYSMSRVKEDPYSFDLTYKIEYFEGKADYTWFMNPNHKLRFGANVINYRIDPGRLDSIGTGSQIMPRKLPSENAIESGIYISDEYIVSDVLSLSYGLRYSGYFALGPGIEYSYLAGTPKSEITRIDTTYYSRNQISFHAGGPEFRFSARYKTGSSSSVKISYTKMYQYLQMLSNTTAISPTDIWKASGQNFPVQKSNQYSVGYYRDLKSNTIESSVELYYKTLRNIYEYRGGTSLLINPDLDIDLINGKGKAYGIEIMFKKNAGGLNGWLSYTYSRSLNKVDSKFLVNQINHGNYYPSNFDKPHDFTMVANYRLSRTHSLSATIKYNTGRPITFPVAKYTFRDREFVHYSNRNEYRTPDYFRIDFSYNIDGTVRAKKKIDDSLSFSIYNVTGRNNAYSIYFASDPVTRKVKGYKLSVFSRPILSLTYNFNF